MKFLALVIAVHVLPVAQLLSTDTATRLSVVEMVAWSACVSMAGGIAAAWRETHQCSTIVKTGLNTAVFGVSIILLSSYWTSQSAPLAWSAIGASGILSLGGLAIVDWGVDLVKRRVEVRADEQDQRPPNETR